MIGGNFRWLAATSTTELFSRGFPQFASDCCIDCNPPPTPPRNKNNQNKEKTNISIKTINGVMTTKKKKVMEEKQPSLPEVVTVQKQLQIPGVKLNRFKKKKKKKKKKK